MVALSKETLWHEGEPLTVQRGDLFQLGAHRLLCGDSTCTEDVQKLMHGKRFTLCFTSPPYSNQRTYNIGTFDWNGLMCGAFDRIIEHGTPDCHILINLGLSHKNRQVDMYWLQWLMHCASVGWPVFGWYVWDKGSGMCGEWNGRLAPAHEFIFHFNNQSKSANKWVPTLYRDDTGNHHHFRQKQGGIKDATSPGKFGQEYKIPDSVIRLYPEKTRGLHTQNHPAVFPVALPEFMMKTWSQPHDIVYEPFCGSGTSLIAGENLKRHVYAMEIDSAYCQLAITRWEAHTGHKAVKI